MIRIPSYITASYKDYLPDVYKLLDQANITPELCLTEVNGELFERSFKDITFFYGNRELSFIYKGYNFIFDVNCYNGIDWKFNLIEVTNEGE